MRLFFIVTLLTACFHQGSASKTTSSPEQSDYPTLTLNHCTDIGEGYGSASSFDEFEEYKIGIQEFTFFYYLVNFVFIFMVVLLPAWNFLLHVTV